MPNDRFRSQLNNSLAEERRRVLDCEFNSDFEILKRQRCGEGSPPSRLYWALKTIPKEFQREYLDCLAGDAPDSSCKIVELLSDRARINDPLLLKKWANSPSIEVPFEYDHMRANVTAFLQRTRYYDTLIKKLCKKAQIKRTFTAIYSQLTGRRMRSVGDSVFVDESLIKAGDARILINWDCGGWTHFREEIGIEWNGVEHIPRQSICSWLGYYPIGAGGWIWITEDDLEKAGHVAVRQTIQFVEILSNCALQAQ